MITSMYEQKLELSANKYLLTHSVIYLFNQQYLLITYYIPGTY